MVMWIFKMDVVSEYNASQTFIFVHSTKGNQTERGNFSVNFALLTHTKSTENVFYTFTFIHISTYTCNKCI